MVNLFILELVLGSNVLLQINPDLIICWGNEKILKRLIYKCC
jgi:hypothetical protein